MRNILITALLCTASIVSSATAADFPGYERLAINAPHREAPIAASVWYQAGKTTYKSVVGDNPVFKGTPAYVGPAIADGKYPLVVLSHGSGGNMDNMGWLSSALTGQGFMVLGLNHPGSTSGDSSPRRSIDFASRAADLRATLDSFLKDPVFGPHVDIDNISVLGFSLGGATALTIAGARMDRAAYRQYCAKPGGKATDCEFFAKGGVDLAALPESWESDMMDKRISAAIAIDPGMAYGMSGESLSAISKPVLLINLGNDERWKAIDVGPKGRNLSGIIPDSEYQVLAPAGHFTFLAECKPSAQQLLIDEGEDPICDDPEGTDRARIHRQIVERVVAFLKEHTR